MFQGADPETVFNGEKIGRLSACMMCPMKHTKPAAGGGGGLVEVVDEVERLIANRKAGIPIDMRAVTPLEHEGMLYWVRYEESVKNAQQRLIAQLLHASLSRPRM